MNFDTRDFRNAMGKFPSGVVVISMSVDGNPHAMTANAFMSGSLEPPLVIISVDNQAASLQKISDSQSFGISILSDVQIDASNHFAGRVVEDFVPEFAQLNGFPVIADAAVQLVTQLKHTYDCGDHTIFVGEVKTLCSHEDNPKPLMFYGGQYHHLGEQRIG